MRVSKERLRAACLLLAVTAAGLGHWLLSADPTAGFVPAVLYGAACLCAVFALRAGLPPANMPAEAALRPPVNQYALATSLTLAAGAVVLAFRGGSSWLQLWLWLASLATLFAVPAVGLPRLTRRPVLRPLPPALGRREWLGAALVAVLALALIFRVAGLDGLPATVHEDEAVSASEARKVLSGELSDLFGTAWQGFPTMSFAVQAAGMALSGDDLVGARASSVLFGMLSVVMVVVAGRSWFGWRVALLAGLLVAVGQPWVHFSRIGLNNVQPVPLMLLSGWLFIDALQRGSLLRFIGAGVSAGLCLYTYFSGQLVLPLLALLAGQAVLQGRWRFPAVRLGIVVVVLTRAVTVAPLGAYFLQHPEALLSRRSAVSVFTPENTAHAGGPLGTDSPVVIVASQLLDHGRAFTSGFDRAPQSHFIKGVLDPVTAVLFVLGLGPMLLGAARRPGLMLLGGWFGLTLVGSAVTVDSPAWTRLSVLAPVVGLVAAFTLDRGLRVITTAFPALNPRALAIPVCGLLLAVVAANYDAYFVRYPLEVNPPSVDTQVAREVAGVPAGGRAYIVSDGARLTGRSEVVHFLAPGSVVEAVGSAGQLPASVAIVPAPTLVVLTPERASDAVLLEQLFPQWRKKVLPRAGAPPVTVFQSY